MASALDLAEEPPQLTPPQEADPLAPLEGLLEEQLFIRRLFENPYSGMAAGESRTVDENRRPFTHKMLGLQTSSSDENERAFIIATTENSFRDELIVCLESVFKDAHCETIRNSIRRRACELIGKVHSIDVRRSVMQEVCREELPCADLVIEGQHVLVPLGTEEQVAVT